MKKNLFPHSSIRKEQDKLITDVESAIKNKQHLIAHAPTGLGKTVAILSPALEYALHKKLNIFFLTSRHTQHIIAIDTLKEIKEKHDVDFTATDLIGRKWMCALPNTSDLKTNEFMEFCKSQREDYVCEFYVNTKKKTGGLDTKAKSILTNVAVKSPVHTEEAISLCKNEKLCPYEFSIALAKESQIIVCDYHHLFHPGLNENFLRKVNKKLENSIIIVDEGHNLPNRIRDLLSTNLSNLAIKRAIKEAKIENKKELIIYLIEIQEILNEFSKDMGLGQEKLIKKEDFVKKVNKIKDYDELLADLEFAGDQIRLVKKQSYIGSIALFLELWQGEDTGFSRILSVKQYKRQPWLTLSYRCLDPSIVAGEIIKKSHSTIIMSGTLAPTSMYKDILGFPENTIERVYKNPFPQENKLSLIIPETTTKFTARNQEQYKAIADICSKITNSVPGNSAIFFPSYSLRNSVDNYFSPKSTKTIFLENPNLKKKEKNDLLDKFKKYKKVGSVLLAVAAANFSEGIDLPGDLLKCVIVVGLPLQPPDLETKELINYYDKKYSKGWDYGYILPAVTKSLQAAGRCIRSETDKGIVVFLDERYVWPGYMKCFPPDWNMKITRDYVEEVKDFFNL